MEGEIKVSTGNALIHPVTGQFISPGHVYFGPALPAGPALTPEQVGIDPSSNGVRVVNDDSEPLPVSIAQSANGVRVVNDGSEPLPVTGPATIAQIKTALDLNGTYAYRTMTLTDNPGDGQLLSFGDGVVSMQFQYTDDIETYQGMDIPIPIGADPTETQTNTVIAYDASEGPKPNVTAISDGPVLIVTSGVMGQAGNITLAVPAEVGVDGGLVFGKDEVNLRNIAVQLSGGIPLQIVTQESEADTEQTLTVAAVTGQRHHIYGVDIYIRGASNSVGMTVELREGATVRWRGVIGEASPKGERIGFILPHGVEFDESAAIDLYVPAGGVGCISVANLLYHTK